MIKKIVWVSLLAFPLAYQSIANSHIMFDKANQSYHNQAYEQAATWYQQMIDDGYHNAEILYNAGNAYYRCGQIGLAIKCYHQSMNEKKEQRTIDNLLVARKAVFEPIYATGTLNGTLLPLINSLNINTWSLASLFSFIALVLWIIIVGLKGSKIKWGGLVLALLYLSTTGGMLYAYYLHALSYPMVIIQKKVRFTSNESSRMYLYDGTEVRFIKKSKKNTLIALPNGEKGWVNSESLSRW
jgi:tetratricopeptide (TPR) repeat protein